MSKIINGVAYTTFDDMWHDPELLTQAEKDEIQLKIDLVRRANFMLEIDAAELQKNLDKYIDLVTCKNETIFVSVEADRRVVIISMEEYTALQNALEKGQYKHKTIEERLKGFEGEYVPEKIDW